MWCARVGGQTTQCRDGDPLAVHFLCEPERLEVFDVDLVHDAGRRRQPLGRRFSETVPNAGTTRSAPSSLRTQPWSSFAAPRSGSAEESTCTGGRATRSADAGGFDPLGIAAELGHRGRASTARSTTAGTPVSSCMHHAVRCEGELLSASSFPRSTQLAARAMVVAVNWWGSRSSWRQFSTSRRGVERGSPRQVLPSPRLFAAARPVYAEALRSQPASSTFRHRVHPPFSGRRKRLARGRARARPERVASSAGARSEASRLPFSREEHSVEADRGPPRSRSQAPKARSSPSQEEGPTVRGRCDGRAMAARARSASVPRLAQAMRSRASPFPGRRQQSGGPSEGRPERGRQRRSARAMRSRA